MKLQSHDVTYFVLELNQFTIRLEIPSPSTYPSVNASQLSSVIILIQARAVVEKVLLIRILRDMEHNMSMMNKKCNAAI